MGAPPMSSRQSTTAEAVPPRYSASSLIQQVLLPHLPERRKAYENLAIRTGLDSVRAVVTTLVQAEKFGTALGPALRVLAQENRQARMHEAEKKAAILPPKLTVPMIVFFLPVLFAVIIAPAVIQISSNL